MPIFAASKTEKDHRSGVAIAEDSIAVNMERKLRLLFAPECGWILGYDFVLEEFIIFPRYSERSAIQ